MKFTRDDLFVGMQYINTNNTIVEIIEFDTNYIVQFSEGWTQTYSMSMETFISRIRESIYKFTPDTLRRIKNKEPEYEIY